MLANPPAPKAQDRAREVRYRRLEVKDMQDIEGERPIQRVFRARADGLAPCRPARRRQRPRAGLRRPQPLYTRRRRPHLRVRWVALALRVPAGRPARQGGNRVLMRPAQGCRAGQGRALEHRVSPRRDRGVPFRARAGVLQRRDRRDPGRLRDREVGLQARQPARQRRGGVDEPYPEKGLVAGRRFGSEEGLRTALFDWVNW